MEKNRNYTTRTRRRSFWKAAAEWCQAFFHPPRLVARVKGDPIPLYPLMSRSAIRRLARSLQKSALHSARTRQGRT